MGYIAVRDRITEKSLRELDCCLHQIFYGFGAYSRDPLEHAGNVVESSKKYAGRCLEILGIKIRPINEVYGDEAFE